MKKSCLTMALAIVLFACNNDKASEENSPAQKNLAAARIIAAAFKSGDVSKIDSVVADDFTDHRPGMDVVGRDSLKALIAFYRTHHPSATMQTISETSDSNYVFQWMLFSGIEEMPEAKMIEVTKFRDGKATEHWTYGDWAEASKMMAGGGNTPPPADTAQKKK